jgi:hypothetical protein
MTIAALGQFARTTGFDKLALTGGYFRPGAGVLV